MSKPNIFILLSLCCLILASCKSEKQPSDMSDDFFSIQIGGVKLDYDIQRIFYGIPVEGSLLRLKDLHLPISIKNGTDKEVNPLVLIANINSEVPLSFSRYYKLYEKKEVQFDSLTTGYEYNLKYDDKVLLPNKRIPFPITEIKVGKEAFTIPIILIFGTSRENMKPVKGVIVIYPITNNRKKQLEFAEQDFLKFVSTLIDWNDPEKTAVVFDTIVVPRLTNFQLLEHNNIKIHKVKELLSK